ncbi:topoisomerase DNA-binding C4 zinc finger domain-containing protein, partial [Yersinia enterocolitica]
MTKTVTAKDNRSCPECGSVLVIRSGGHGPFLGCSHYPDC